MTEETRTEATTACAEAMPGEAFQQQTETAPLVPSLSFEEPEAAAIQEAPAPVPTSTQAEPEEAILSLEEARQAEAFAKQIDITNTQAVMTYGIGTQKKMADFSEKTLESVKTKDFGKVGGIITSLMAELKEFDAEEEEKGIFGFFKKSSGKLDRMKAKYSKVETSVDTITRELEKHQVTLMKDISMLDQMYELNLGYYKELTMYILADTAKPWKNSRKGHVKRRKSIYNDFGECSYY